MSSPNPEAIHNGNEPEFEDAFRGVPFNMAMLTTLLRCYDLLTVIAKNTNPEATREVIDLHRQGDFWNDPPIWAPRSWAALEDDQ